MGFVDKTALSSNPSSAFPTARLWGRASLPWTSCPLSLKKHTAPGAFAFLQLAESRAPPDPSGRFSP